MSCIELSGELFVSYSYLRTHVSQKTIEDWKQRNIGRRYYFNQQAYISYNTIPARTRKDKLPIESELRSLIHEQNASSKQAYFNKLLDIAYETEFLKYRDEYSKDKRLTLEQVTTCAKLRAVWEKVLQQRVYRGTNEFLYKAFTKIYPEKYTDYNSFSATKTKAKKNINSVVIDSRWFRDHDSPFDDKIIFWTKALLSDPVSHTGKSIWRMLAKLCKEASLTPPSYSWVKKFVRANERNHEIFSSRFGKSVAFNQIEPYAKMTYDYAGSQWQLDGWNLPFYTEGWNKLVLFAVRDPFSLKIVGYSVDKSENTQMILEALQDAVKNTGFLPSEIVSDNHSFHKTQEAGHFKQALDSIGVIWNVDHNPRRKAKAERYFRHLGEFHCKEYPGYTGQGIKTKEKTGRPSQEYLDKFTKSRTWLTEDEVKAIAVKVVDEFNNSPLEKLQGKTPNEAHEESDKPHILTVDLFTRLRLFTKQNKIKVIRGQINLKRSGTIYEYQLNADQFQQFNGREVIIRYEDFSTVYLFDEKDRPLGSVNQKVSIHGAIAEQTPEDIKLLQKNKGRLNGIKSKAKKANEASRDRVSPGAFEALNPMTTAKEVLKEVEQSYLLKQRARELGVNLEMAEVGLKPKNMLPESLQEKEKKMKSPFSVRGKHKVDVVDLKKEEEDY
jgi:hypothetical protein